MEELEGSPGPKTKVQRIVWEVIGAQDWKSEVHKTKGARTGCSNGDGEWYSGWYVDGAMDEWFQQFKNPTKSVFQFLSTRFYSPGIPETVKLKIAVKFKRNE